MAQIGADFEHVDLKGYININRYYKQVDRLHGTETFMGDWSGALLVLGQDFCHTALVADRVRQNSHKNPYYHDPDRRVNQGLVNHLRSHLPLIELNGKNAKNCGALYANIIWLLKDTPKIDSTPPHWRAAVDASRPVTLATLQGMTRLKAVLCLGSKPYEGMLAVLGIKGHTWRSDLELTDPVMADGVRIVPTAHRVANRLDGNFPTGARAAAIRNDVEKCFA